MDISLLDVHLSIGKAPILRGISLFPLITGEVHGIVGGNGSGKSTLLNLLAGYLPRRIKLRGTLEMDGLNVLPFYDRTVAKALRIYLVPQQPPIVRGMTVIDNLFLGNEASTKLGLLARKTEMGRAKQLLEELGWDLALGSSASDLSTADRQKLAIARVLLRDRLPNFLLLDEPTTQLSDGERQSLLQMIRQLANGGSGIVLVSHRPMDIVSVSKRVSVLQNGRVDAVYDAADLSKEDLKIEAFGPSTKRYISSSVVPPHEVLRFELNGQGDIDGSSALRISINGGEIVGLREGHPSARSSIFSVKTLRTEPVRGKLVFKGLDVTGATMAELRKSCFSFVPASTVELGLVAALTVQENLLLYSRNIGLWIWSSNAETNAASMGLLFQIPGKRLLEPVVNFSGGYKQRVVLAREFGNRPLVVLLQNPSQGIDASTLHYLVAATGKMMESGGCGLLISSDDDELAMIASRIFGEEQASQ